MANEWNKSAFVEFETMLRRHLRSGAAPVTACAGFDLDSASAYLEGALDEWRRAGYESHLAGCAMCRRNLIELARLAQTTPRFEAQPVTVADQTPAWVRWREVVVGWFDLSAWNFKWQITGVAGAAFAILIVALGVQSWRQASNQAADAFKLSATSSAAPESGLQTPQSPIVEPSPQNEQLLASGASIAKPQEQPRVSVPVPFVRPIDGLPLVADAPSNNSLRFPSSQTLEALPPIPRPDTRAEARENRDSALQGQLSPQGAQTPSANNLHNNSGPYLAGLRAQSQAADLAAQSQNNSNEIAAGINPQFGINQANTEQKPIQTRGKTEKLTPLILPNRIRKSISLLVPWKDSDPKPEPDRKAKVDDSNDESFNPMIRRMRGKVFIRDKGMWIDQEYKPEMQQWRRWTLTRGSEEYKKVLANNPLLKEFFDLGPILIVWKNGIYKVLK